MITRTVDAAADLSRPLLSREWRAAALAAGLMLVASALFALQAALVKVGLQQMAPLELVFFRGLVCAGLILAVARLGGQSLATRRPLAQIGLGIVGFVATALYFVSIGLLPLVTATALNYTAPLFLALVVGAHQARGTRVALFAWVACGFLGACFVLQPSLAGGSSIGVALGLGSGLAAAASYMLLGRLGRSGESERVTGFYFSLVICALAGVPTLATGFSIGTFEQLGIVLAIGLLATAAQLAVAKAYAIGSPVIPATFSYSTVIFSSLLGVLCWGETLGLLETVGIALIVASGALVLAGQSRLREPAPSTPLGEERRPTEEMVEKQRKRYYLKNNLRAIYALVKLAGQPNHVPYAHMMGDAQDNITEGERVRGKIANPFADPELEAMWREGYKPAHYDVDALARMPADTLGGAYGRHMKANGLRPDFYEDVKPRHRMHYLRLRMRQTHDIWHVLTGFGTDEFGEVGVQAFYFGQFTNGMAAMLAAAVLLKYLLRGKFAELEKHFDAICQGYVNGKRAQPMLAVKWEELWGEKVETLRKRYGVELPHLLRANANIEPLRAAA
jgi:ubiquinone biosynthesis protein Coq4/drug/metabolite transporter (DMT)-like permease